MDGVMYGITYMMIDNIEMHMKLFNMNQINFND